MSHFWGGTLTASPENRGKIDGPERPMTEPLHYVFAGTDGLVDLSGCKSVADLLPEVFQNWPHERAKAGATKCETIFEIRRTPEHFTLSSPVFGSNQNLKDPLNTACSLVAELAWARLKCRPEMLCFHGAAVEVNGSLVLFPNQRRAGKSTLTACLAALGYRVFTDDYLPIEIDENGVMFGHANGAAPRLRLPLPEEFSSALVNALISISGPSNRQYLYLNPPDRILAQHGERLPISTIVMLDRTCDAEINLSKALPAKILRRVILQNFSRHMNPARILGMIDHLVQSTRGFTLRYEHAEAAAAFLNEVMRNFPRFEAIAAYRAEPELVPPEPCDAPDTLSFDPGKSYVRSKHVVERDYGTDCFVASTRGLRIHHMNLVARAIWRMLQEPSKLDDIVDVFVSAFPDKSEEVLRHDICKSLGKFAEDGLLHQVE